MIWSGKNFFYCLGLVLFISCNSDKPNFPDKWNYGVIPKVQQLKIEEGGIHLGDGWAVLPTKNLEDLGADLEHFLDLELELARGSAELPSQTIYLLEVKDKDYGIEGYKLQVRNSKVLIEGQNPIGVARGLATLKQLILLNEHEGNFFIPELEINDYASFKHRGMLLDCCRHFFSKEVVKKYIDLLALFKMNTLHWHLTEDQGWRIEIAKYPELTKTGAFRIKQDGTEYGGFYTKEDIREIVAYASERQIEIIPEIELPGHSQAAVAAYPHLSCTGNQVEVANDWGVFKEIYCAGNDSVFIFLEDVLTEVMELFPSKKIHIGGDEAPKVRWEECDKCQKRIEEEGLQDEHELQAYFIRRIQDFLKENGRELIGWDEILEGGSVEGAIIQSWRSMQGGVEAVKHESQAIMSPTSHAYFDYDLRSIDLEKVYSFNPVPSGLSPEEAELIIGGECNMWTERVPDEKNLDSKVFPRLLAMSEVLWSDSANRDFTEFQSRVEEMYAILDRYKVNYGEESLPFTYDVRLTQDEALVEILPYSENIDVHYQRLCEGCDSSMVKYENPIPVDQNFTLLVEAKKGRRKYGEPKELVFRKHKGVNANVRYQTAYSDWYTAGGSKALVDSKLGSLDFRDGNWQGFWGDDLECVVELREPEYIREVSANFYQYNNSWIIIPRGMKVFVSLDGENWDDFGVARSGSDPKQRGHFIDRFKIRAEEQQEVKYLKLLIENYGKLPDWHEASGQDSWIFIDEIIIR